MIAFTHCCSPLARCYRRSFRLTTSHNAKRAERLRRAVGACMDSPDASPMTKADGRPFLRAVCFLMFYFEITCLIQLFMYSFTLLTTLFCVLTRFATCRRAVQVSVQVGANAPSVHINIRVNPLIRCVSLTGNPCRCTYLAIKASRHHRS